MDVPEKPKKVINRANKREKSKPVVTAQEGIDTSNQVGKETTKYVKKLYKTIQENQKKPVYDVLVDPLDFGQTVENFFYFSFLVKDGHSQITLDKNGEPFLGLFDNPIELQY